MRPTAAQGLLVAAPMAQQVCLLRGLASSEYRAERQAAGEVFLCRFISRSGGQPVAAVVAAVEWRHQQRRQSQW